MFSGLAGDAASQGTSLELGTQKGFSTRELAFSGLLCGGLSGGFKVLGRVARPLLEAGPPIENASRLKSASNGAEPQLYWHGSPEKIADVTRTGVLGQKVGAGEKYWATTKTLDELGWKQMTVGGRINLYPPGIKPPFTATYEFSSSEAAIFKRAWGPEFSYNPFEWWKGAVGQYYFRPVAATLGQRFTEAGVGAIGGGAAVGIPYIILHDKE